MTLEKREKRFSEICGNFHAFRPGKLIAYHLMADGYFTAIKTAASQFISKSISTNFTILDENILLDNIEKIDNMTPNGKILPKPFSLIEYNVFLKCVNDLLRNLNFGKHMELFRVPVLRYKPAIPVNNNRSYSTEIAHLEAWFGHSKDTITIQIPLFGDIERNYTALLSPPDSFEESWLNTLTDFKLGDNIAGKYIEKKVLNNPRIMKVFESSTLHQTVREDGCGPRVSLDMMFVCNTTITKTDEKDLRKVDFGLPPNEFLELGKTKIFYPKDTMSGMIEKEKIIEI